MATNALVIGVKISNSRPTPHGVSWKSHRLLAGGSPVLVRARLPVIFHTVQEATDAAG